VFSLVEKWNPSIRTFLTKIPIFSEWKSGLVPTASSLPTSPTTTRTTLSVPFYYYGNVAESAGPYWSNIFVTCTTSISCTMIRLQHAHSCHNATESIHVFPSEQRKVAKANAYKYVLPTVIAQNIFQPPKFDFFNSLLSDSLLRQLEATILYVRAFLRQSYSTICDSLNPYTAHYTDRQPPHHLVYDTAHDDDDDDDDDSRTVNVLYVSSINMNPDTTSDQS
jgi:hypothetical protein